MIEFVTDSNPIKNINTCEVKLSESEVYKITEQAIINAFKTTSTPCITKIISEVKRALKQAYNKPQF